MTSVTPDGAPVPPATAAPAPVYGTPDDASVPAYEIRLRPLEARDLRHVERLEQRLFGRGAWSHAMLAEELGGLGRWYVAAEPVRPYLAGPQEVVGYAGLWFDGEVAQIMTIGVDPDLQHQGIGRTLLEALIARARVLRAAAVLLEVAVDNAPALRLYEGYGFERLGVRRKYYWPEGTDAYTMRLELEAPEGVAAPGAADRAARAAGGTEAPSGPGPVGA